MSRRQRARAQKAFEEFEMLTGWPPDHEKEVLAGKIKLQEAMAENVKRFLIYSKKTNAGLKNLLARL